MKEQSPYQSKSEIKWPQTEKVEVGTSVDFIYIMRKDGDFTMSPIAQSIANEYSTNEEEIKQILLGEYDTFFSKLADILQWSYSPKGNFQLHLYDSKKLEAGIRTKAEEIPIISLDPLMNQRVLEHKVSRGYFLSGRKDFGQVSRPGTSPLSNQALEIAYLLNGSPAIVAEDDIFSGGSVIASLAELKNSGVQVQKLITGIQVGKPSKLSELDISVDPIVIYQTTDGTDIFDRVDLGDPRDYLLGASGLVIKLSNGNYGRAPYILPFVSTSARAGIPQEKEREFAVKVLKANFDFYKNFESIIGKPILLKNMDPNFVLLMNEMFGFDSNCPMDQVVAWSIDNMDKLWEITKAQGEIQEQLNYLELPKNIVFLDVNGTLIPDGAKDGFIPKEDMQLLQEAIIEAHSKGISIGLCSDSPLQQLSEFGARLGISGPIIAENGNLISNNGNISIVNSLDAIDTIKARVSETANTLNYQQINDSIAPEFGGKKVVSGSTNWSFGANRIASVTVFGPAPLIESLGNTYGVSSEYSVDASPEYNYFAIHPGTNFKENKGKILTVLSKYGYNVVMVGNSSSDWVNPESGVQCTFVANSRIDNKIMEKAAFISNEPLVKGVVDIIKKVQ